MDKEIAFCTELCTVYLLGT